MERKISVASIMSDDSYDPSLVEEVGRNLGSAIGFSRQISGYVDDTDMIDFNFSLIYIYILILF